MKYITISAALALSLTAGAVEYYSNDGRTPPGTFSKKETTSQVKTTTIEREEVAPAARNKTGVHTPGLSTEDVNTSPNRAPTTDAEVIEGSVLSTEGIQDDGLIEAQEAYETEHEVIEFSTKPEKRDQKK